MEQYSRNFPKGLKYQIPFDVTKFVRESVNEVYRTLYEAGILVLLVIMIFLQDWRATLVPATTVPVTIIGAFAGMALLGFTINLLTLFAIVLAIGIVVDDAIVVVEGAAKHIERGQAPKQASIDAMRELFGPIIGITLVLMSVFLPPAFMPGITGQMYRQFALVIAITAIISAINAMTLKPTQCALWLRPHDPHRKKNLFFRWFNSVYEPTEQFYVRLIRTMVQRSQLMVVIALALVALAGWGLTRIPTGFIPTEDQGYLMISVQLPDGASLERTERVMNEITQISRQIPGVDHAIAIGGISALDNNASLANAGMVYLVLKDWGERGRGEDLRSIYQATFQGVGQTPELRQPGAGPAPDPGSGAIGRVPDAVATGRRQLRFHPAAARRRRNRRRGQIQPGHPVRVYAVPRPGASGYRDRGSVTGRNIGCARRRRARHPAELSRVELREPVYQVRPQFYGLRASRGEAPADAGRHQGLLRPQPKRANGATGHAGRH